MRCPDCNVDRTDPRNINDVTVSCQDCMGSNMKSMGGYAGLATGMAFATEYQGEATPHGHGFVSLANMYQHHNLEQIGNMIESNWKRMTPEDMLDRVKSFVSHLQREDHMDNEGHQRNLRKFEADFHTNNAGPEENVHLSVRPARFYTCSSSPCAWGPQNRTRSADSDNQGSIPPEVWDKVAKDAAEFEREYTTDVQFIRVASPNSAEAAKRRIVYFPRVRKVVLSKHVWKHARCIPQTGLHRYRLRHVVRMPPVVPITHHLRHVSRMPEVVPNQCRLRQVVRMPEVVPRKYRLRHVGSIPQVVPNKYHLRHVRRIPQVVPSKCHLRHRRQHDSSGTEQVPLAAWWRYASSGTGQVPLEACRQHL